MNLEHGPESRRRTWNPERAPRLHTSIEDVEKTIETAIEDPDHLSQGDKEVLEYWLPILTGKEIV